MKNNFKKLLVVAAFFSMFGFFGVKNVYAEGETETCSVASVNNECVASFDDVLTSLTDLVSNGVRTINVTFYSDLSDDATGYYTFPQNANITINLNGHDLTVARQFIVFHTKVKVTGTGSIISSNSFMFTLAGSTAENVSDYTVLTIDKDVTLVMTGSDSTFISMSLINGAWLQRKNGVTLNFNGTLRATDEDSSDDTIGIYVNGTYGMTSNTVFNIGETAKIELMHVPMYLAGGITTNYAGEAHGIYSGIEIRAGVLNITGGYVGVGEEEFGLVEHPYSSTSTYGTAIALSQHTTKKPIHVNISGGKFLADRPFVEINPIGNAEEYISQVTAEITGGEFISNSAVTVSSEDMRDFIKGGTYTVAPSNDLIHDDYETVENTNETYTVLPKEILFSGKTVPNFDGANDNTSVKLETPVRADREDPMHFNMLSEESLNEIIEKNPDIENIIGGFDVSVIRYDGSIAEVTDNNITINFGLTTEQYNFARNYRTVKAHFVNDEGEIIETFTGKFVNGALLAGQSQSGRHGAEFKTSHLSTFVISVSDLIEVPLAPNTGVKLNNNEVIAVEINILSIIVTVLLSLFFGIKAWRKYQKVEVK